MEIDCMKKTYRFVIAFIAGIIICFSNNCRAQTDCMQLCFDMVKNRVSVNNRKIQKHKLRGLEVYLYIYNCDEKIIRFPGSMYLGQYCENADIYNRLKATPLYVTIYKKRKVLYERYCAEAIHDTFARSRPVLDTATLLMVLPKEQEGVSMKTDFFEKLPVGEYEVGIDYVREIEKGIGGKSTEEIDSKMRKKYFSSDAPISPGYYIQHSRNLVHFTVTK